MIITSTVEAANQPPGHESESLSREKTLFPNNIYDAAFSTI